MKPYKRRKPMIVFCAFIAALFVAGVVWQAVNPTASDNPAEEREIGSRQDGYYLCLHRKPMTPGEMYKLIARELPKDDRAAALRGCQQAQER